MPIANVRINKWKSLSRPQIDVRRQWKKMVVTVHLFGFSQIHSFNISNMAFSIVNIICKTFLAQMTRMILLSNKLDWQFQSLMIQHCRSSPFEHGFWGSFVVPFWRSRINFLATAKIISTYLLSQLRSLFFQLASWWQQRFHLNPSEFQLQNGHFHWTQGLLTWKSMSWSPYLLIQAPIRFMLLISLP